MSLRLFVDSLDSVPEHLKSEYVPDKEGGYRLGPSRSAVKTMSRAQFDELSVHEKAARMKAGFTLYN
jgi:hypothetical protein